MQQIFEFSANRDLNPALYSVTRNKQCCNYNGIK